MIVWGGYSYGMYTSTGAAYHRPLACASVSGVTHKGDPFRVYISGSNLQQGVSA